MDFKNCLYVYQARLRSTPRHPDGIVDADTIDVSLDRGFRDYSAKRVRVLGVDTDEIYGRGVTPEGKIRGKAAVARVKEVINLNTPLYIRTELGKDYDSFGRVLGWVYFLSNEGSYTNLGEMLFEEGYNKPEK
jgi:endonuclease YncB( thermonuclease family)